MDSDQSKTKLHVSSLADVRVRPTGHCVPMWLSRLAGMVVIDGMGMDLCEINIQLSLFVCTVNVRS